MLNAQQRKSIRQAQDEASIQIQVWLANLVKDADHGDEPSEDMLRYFLKVWRKTHSPKQGYGAVMLAYDQLTLEDA